MGNGPLRSLPVRIAAACRYGGPRYAVRRVAGGNWAGTYALYSRDVAVEDSLESSPGVPVETVGRTLQEDELDAYLELRPSTGRAEPLRRMAAGHFCWAMWMSERIVSAVWIREDVIWLPAVKRSIALERHEAYAYDSFTDPASRRSGIARRRKIALGEHLHDRGVTRLFTYVRSENRPSIRSLESSGYLPAGRLRFLRLGPVSAMIPSWDDDTLRERAMDRAPDEYRR